jgi:hypothetical protein
MSQHDYVIANGTGAAVRSDLNGALAAIVTQNSGATAPATTYAYMWWADTTTGLLKIRNAANNAWVTIGSLSTSGFGLLAAGDTLTAALGSASTPGITFTGDLNTGIYSPGADQVAISTNGTGRLFIDSSGRALVGTATARDNFFNTSGLGGLLQVEGANNNARRVISHVYGVAAVGGPMLALGKHRGNSVGDNTVVQSGDECGLLAFQGSDGTEFVEAAQIRAEVDGTPGANDMPGRLVFSTTADGASSPTERMRITSTGQVRLAGAGITFNGDTATANELDDYEEGTWTPTPNNVVVNSGTPTYSGSYTKIGNVVTVQGGQSGGNITVSGSSFFGGLPFTVGGGKTSANAYSCVGTNNGGIGYAYESSTNFYIVQVISSGTATGLRFSATYYI